MFVFDIIGTIAFAMAGALTAIQKKLDIFGVFILAVTTAMGGGLMRDIMIGNTPPIAVRAYEFVLISIMSAVFVMAIHRSIDKFNFTIQVCDAIGLGAFTVAGANMAIDFGLNNVLSVTFFAVVTGVGGGVIRDIFIQEIPGVFCKEIYAVASLLGSVCFYYIYPHVSLQLAMYVAFIVTTLSRLIAMKYNIHLPIIQSIGSQIERKKAECFIKNR